MAPDTTGVAFTDQVRSHELTERALDIAAAVGCPGGAFVAKLLMGAGFDELLTKLRGVYERTKTVRPAATRKSSTEVYVVGLRKRRNVASPDDGRRDPEAQQGAR